MRVLVIEDSERLRRSLEIGLRRSGYAVDLAADGAQGLWSAQSNAYDVIVLDLMLPEVDGLTVLQTLRRKEIASGVIILTAKDCIEDRVRGLKLGADDYLVKPFSFDELLARIQAITRRRHGVRSPEIVIGDLQVDTAARTVRRGGAMIELPPREYALLEYLALRKGQVVTRTEIETHIYDEHVEPASNVVDAAIYALRRKIDPADGPSFIQTRRGMGYSLLAVPA